MTEETQALTSQPQRSQWPRLLQAVNTTTTVELAKRFNESYLTEDIHLPESGLALLKNRDGAKGEDYFLGEIPLSRAHVRLFIEKDISVEGAAQILDDRSVLARAIATLDAVLANQLPGHEVINQLLNEGERLIKRGQEQRHALLNSTLVNFSLLGIDEESIDD